MIKTVLLIILLIVTIGMFAVTFRLPDPEDRKYFRLATIIPAVLFILLGIFSTFVVVGATDVGVPVAFGRAGDPMTSGVHAKAPWTKVETFPVRPFSVPDIEITARTSQAGQVKAIIGARWHIDPARARDTYLQIRTGDEDRISKEVIDKALGQATGNVFVAKDNMTATTDRAGVEAALLTEINRLTAPFGVTVDNVFVRSVEPDQKTADALARVAAQQRETEIATESVKTATERAKANLEDAKGVKSAAAEIPAGITPEQVHALCIQAWERTAAKAITAGAPLYTSPCGASSAIVPAGK